MIRPGNLVKPATNLCGTVSSAVRLYNDSDVSSWNEYIKPGVSMLVLETYRNQYSQQISKVFHPSHGIGWVYSGDLEEA